MAAAGRRAKFPDLRWRNLEPGIGNREASAKNRSLDFALRFPDVASVPCGAGLITNENGGALPRVLEC